MVFVPFYCLAGIGTLPGLFLSFANDHVSDIGNTISSPHFRTLFSYLLLLLALMTSERELQ